MSNKVKDYLKRMLRRKRMKEENRRRRKLRKQREKNDAVPKENEKKNGRGWCKFLKRIFRK